MKFFFKSIIFFISKPYFWFRSRYFIWRNLLNIESGSYFKKNKKDLNDIQVRIVDDLTHNGIAITSLGEFFGDDNLLSKLQEYANSLKQKAVTRAGKPFLKRLWPDDLEINLNNPFLKLVFSENILNILGNYIGSAAKYFYSSLDITLPISKNMPWVRSQNWHRDPEDLKMCKIFIYLSDVDDTAGPFVYIPKSQFGGLYGNIYPQEIPRGSYPPEGKIESLINPNSYKACTAKAGTIIFGDTAGLHRGGYATEKERLMFTAEFSSKASLRAPKYRYSAEFKNQKNKLGLLGQYATSNDFGFLKIFNKIADLCVKYGIHDKSRM